MNEMLPPDPARLRVILAHLEQQLANEETVVTYLRLQRDAVQRALAAVGQQQRTRQREDRGLGKRDRRLGDGKGFMAEQVMRPLRHVALHVDDCPMANGPTRVITEAELRTSLHDPEAFHLCEFCQPQERLDEVSA
ncbi:DUF6233 domain-containing protein [Streptomyces sp. NBC_00620]|uniref:DUF6233 domain-containing protein n=1 Tax=Streptomyces sp. NBC_00620 TaxID=2903666 RepID=UPI002253FFA1|nr:DUF6233 domain-containing protein [Streptomyces sp. NBC_00620]MCX4974252.1 DUF6233 domain-containing protein [Streptomyces sp. NBC_00620]